jgi:putative DNA primase/helicase
MAADASDNDNILPTPAAPMNVARALLDADYTDNGHVTLLFWRGDFYEHVGTHWRRFAPDQMRHLLWRRTEHASYQDSEGNLLPWRPKRDHIGNLLDALEAACEIDVAVEPNTWIDERKNDGAIIVPMRNGLLRIDTVGRTLLPPTPALFNVNYADVNYDPAATCPEFLKFINSVWPEDQKSKDLLQEWSAYLLSLRRDLHKILFLAGVTRSGKGTIAHIIRRLMGKDNCVPISLHDLSRNNQFGLEDLVGKAVPSSPTHASTAATPPWSSAC